MRWKTWARASNANSKPAWRCSAAICSNGNSSPAGAAPAGRRTIKVQRDGIALRIKRTPSLKASLNDPEWWQLAWGDAVYQAETETGLNEFPESCPWTIDQVLNQVFLPA